MLIYGISTWDHEVGRRDDAGRHDPGSTIDFLLLNILCCFGLNTKAMISFRILGTKRGMLASLRARGGRAVNEVVFQ